MATPVFFIHDGAIDELICIPFLTSMPNIILTGVWVTPSDCIGIPTAIVCGQILDFIDAPEPTLYRSDTGSERAFPWTYRQYSLMVNLLPLLNPPGTPKPRKISFISRNDRRKENLLIAKDLVEKVKRNNDQQGESCIFLITSPMTDFLYLLETFPDLQSEIASVAWMGGSLKAGGNIDTGIAIGANPNAEWNAYWDPYAVKQIFASGLKIDMFPLDVTNQFLLTTAVLREYFLPKAGNSQMMDLASQMYALVAFQAGFSFWDTAAAAYLGQPSLFNITSQNLDINIDEFDFNNFGCIIQNGKYPVNVATATSVPNFYSYLTSQLASVK